MESQDSSEPKFNVYQAITDQVVGAIKAGAGKYVMPWHTQSGITRPANAYTGDAYRGVNVLTLWVSGCSRQYRTGHWASFKQWQRLNASVRKGERGSIIVFYKEHVTAESEDEADPRPRLYARASRVFNADQVDGWRPPELPEEPEAERVGLVDAFVQGTGAAIRYGGEMAQYCHREDVIDMPQIERFRATRTSTATQAYYATLCHELVHWAGAPHRLNRQFGERYGDRAYAFEELVAELGAAFLCATFSVANDPRPDHAAYVANWLEVLNRDTKAIFMAASQAEKAVSYLLSLWAEKRAAPAT